MLVLSRRLQDSILLTSLGITIRVLKVRRQSVSLGITAPDHIRIARGVPAVISRSDGTAAGGLDCTR